MRHLRLISHVTHIKQVFFLSLRRISFFKYISGYSIDISTEKKFICSTMICRRPKVNLGVEGMGFIRSRN